MSNDELSSRKVQVLHFLFPVLMLLGWFLWLERGRGKLKRNQRSVREPERSLRKRFI